MIAPKQPGLTKTEIMELLDRMQPPSLPFEVIEKLPKLRGQLSRLDRQHTLVQLAGLQAKPEFQANAIRLDWAMRLVAAFANGAEKLKRDKLETFLNITLKKADVTCLEDPIEDFFVTPVVTRDGEFLTFEGTWENASFHTQSLLEAFSELPEGRPKLEALARAHAMLLFCDAVIRKAGLDRWAVGSGEPASKMKLPSQRQLNAFPYQMKLSWEEVRELVPDPALLAPFVLPEEPNEEIAKLPIGNAPIDFKPLIADSTGITLIAPGSITTAVRGNLINEAVAHGMNKALQRRLLAEEASRLKVCGFIDLTDGPDMPAGDEIIRQFVKEISKGHFVHFVLSVDSFENWAETGFSGMTPHEDAFFAVVFEGAKIAQRAARESPNFKQGLTLLLLGGWGQGRILEFEVPLDLRSWQFQLLQPDDVVVLSGLDDAKLPDLWRIWRLERVIRGMEFDLQNPSGFLNLFQWWRESDYAFVPEHELDLVAPCLINFGSDRLLKARQESANLIDRRSVQYVDDSFRRVTRVDPRTFFADLEPIYACVDAIEEGHLLGVVLVGKCPVWVSRKISGGRTDDEYETWRSILRWVRIGLYASEGMFEAVSTDPIQIEIEIEWPDNDRLDDPISLVEIEKSLSYRLNSQKRSAVLCIGAIWHRGLRREDNAAEVALAALLLSCVADLRGEPLREGRARTLIRDHIGNDDYRWRHALMADRPIELMRAHGLIGSRYRPVPLSAASLAKCASALSVQGSRPCQRIEGEDACFEFLTKMRADLLSSLCKATKHYRRELLVLMALSFYQEALIEQRSWEMSARALRIIHGVEGDRKASLQRRNQVNASIRACSIITEIASSQASSDDGYEVGSIDFDELQAAALQVFAISDLIPAIRAGQIKPEISISPTGHLLHDHSFGEKALGSTVQILHAKDRFDQSQAYSKFFRDTEPQPEAPDERFLAALEAEYGVHAEVFVQFANFLVTIAVDMQRGAFTMRRSELLDRLRNQQIEGTPDFGPLIDRLTLPCRNGWDDLPSGSHQRDFDISRFDRRFSLIGRPLVSLTLEEDPLLAIAPGIVERAARHNVAGASAGGLQGEFWSSKEMRSYVGRAGGQSGLAFNDRVAEAVQAQGLSATSSVKPSGCLDHKATDQLKLLGDIDVLAFTPDGRHAWVIEVKDIKLCRTLSETAKRLSDYRGVPLKNGKPDNLLRHLNRVEYVRKHAADLARRNKLPTVPEVHGLVIVDVPQPMTFVIASDSPDARFALIDALDEVSWREV